MTRSVCTKKAAIIIGSPRRDGSTAVLAGETVRGLTSRGIMVETIWLNELSLRDCQGCHGCKQPENSSCILDDDMQDVYRSIRGADGLIVASPVYFGNVSGITRLWLDRLVPFIGPDMAPLLTGGIPVSFIFTQNLSDTNTFAPDLRSFMNAVSMTGLSVRDFLIAGDCEAGLKPPVSGRQDLLERAYAIGQDLMN